MGAKSVGFAFLIFIIIFGIAQFSYPYIIGFDGYYHIKAAELVKDHGLIKDFPWAKYTILSEKYADTQFLFRFSLIPFIALFGLILGAKIAASVFAAIALTIFYWFLKKNEIRFPFFWSLLYIFASAELLYRFMLGRQMPLAIAIIMLTIYFLQNKKYLLLSLVSFAFVWLYSGFVIQLFVVFAYFIIERLFIKKWEYKIVLYPVLGAIAGIIINPYFPNNLSLLYIQIFKVNLLSNLYNVEWKAWPFWEFIKNNFIILPFFLLSLIATVKNKKLAKMQAYFLALAFFFFIYTIVSRRMQEYFVPFAVLASVFIINDYLQSLEKNKSIKILKISGILLIVLIASINFAILKKSYLDTEFLHNYNGCAEWMKGNIPKNSLVFINAYAFPYLFYENSDLVYTHGLDLTYSYLYDAKKFERYIGILQGTLKNKTDFIVDDYNPDYVFSGKLKQDVQLFNYIVAHKENYKAVYEDDWCAVLKVKKAKKE